MVRFAKDTQTVNAGEGIERKVLAFGKSVMLCEVCLKKGAVLPPHRHPHEQVSYMVSGSASFTVNGEKAVLSAGDSIAIPANAVHTLTALEDSVVTDSFSPVREDFLQ